ncbi:MAG: hypothetical protein GXY13_13015 [Acidimicrobiales bacterium]|nr:hypothetical protein [Acidimicrobiales bacterium]
MAGTDELFPGGLRDVRYGEVLLLDKTDEGTFSAQVWNTLGLNDCPQAAWDALDPAAIAAERGVLGAVLNGPRHWVLDTIVNLAPPGPRTFDRFGELDMSLVATVDLGDELPDGGTYVERRVVRDTIFRFRAGSDVYELHAPDGPTYVLQAYSRIVDADQTIDDLPRLGERLALPDGWTFTVRTLDRDLDLLSTDGVATIVQDELQNTYQRVDRVTIDAMAGAAS